MGHCIIEMILFITQEWSSLQRV